MAAPTDYSARVASEPQEDCRDYLRTGRCKYGASCKYNHPPNVQSGGGMKGPIDPSEPLFPIRPNEPPCQYYMKHGTCKFGQACKFHHPPQSAMRAAVAGGGPVVMNVGTGRSGDAGVTQHIVLKTLGSEHGTGNSSMTLQFLPQRPDEADCIYFLRNGRCKYGATCRYHHPITVQQRKPQQPSRVPIDASNRSSSMPEMRSQPVQFVSQQPSSSGYGQHGEHRNVGSAPTHILVADGSLSFVTMNNGIPTMDSSYQIGSSSSAGMHQGYSSVPSSPLMTASSVASSYETATSDILSAAAADSSSTSWNRPTRTTSGGSLSALAGSESPGQGQPQYRRSGNRVTLPSSASDTNIAGRHRPVPTSNVGTQYIDNSPSYHSAVSGGWAAAAQTTQPSGGRNPRGPQEGNSIAFEHRYQVSGHPYGSAMSNRGGIHEGEAEYYHESRTRTSSRMSGRNHQNQPRRRSSVDDDGMSKMTSALLTMLDTPEEAGSYGNREASSSTESFPGRFLSDGAAMANQYLVSNIHDRGTSLPDSEDANARTLVASGNTPNRETSRSLCRDASASSQNTMNGDVPPSNWSPRLQASIGRPLEQNVQSMSALQPPHHSTPNSPHFGGLFLS